MAISTIVILSHHSVESLCVSHVTPTEPSDWLPVHTILCHLAGTPWSLVAHEMQSAMVTAEAV